MKNKKVRLHWDVWEQHKVMVEEMASKEGGSKAAMLRKIIEAAYKRWKEGKE